MITANSQNHNIIIRVIPKGDLLTEGQYKKGKKTGVWKFYEQGRLVKEKDFTYKPKYVKVNGKYKKTPQ